jgi:hypothetical protein
MARSDPLLAGSATIDGEEARCGGGDFWQKMIVRLLRVDHECGNDVVVVWRSTARPPVGDAVP